MMLRTVTISVLIGTILIGTYYVVAASYVQPEQQNQLTMALDSFQSGLTYDKLVSLDQNQRNLLMQQMPSNTIIMTLEEAKNHPSFIAESRNDMLTQSHLSDLKQLKIAPIAGLKGFTADGTVSVFSSGDMSFLRLEDFGVTSGIDQRIYLTKDGTIESGIDIGILKASQGNQNYDITGIDTDVYNIFVVYSKTFDVYYAHAQLPKSS